MEPLITVIIPIYNAEKYMQKCLDSVLNQTYKNLEVILIDDGSTDNSFEVCKDIAKIDSRIRVFQQQNSGPGVARNRGLDLALGEFICFMDSDDTFELTAIEKMLERMDESCDMVQCRYEKVYDNGIKDNELFPEKEIVFDSVTAMQDYLWNDKPIVRFAVWAKLIRKSAVGNIRFPELKNSEDVVFNAYLIDACRKIKYIPDILYHVEVRQGSLSRSGFSEEKMNARLECNNKIIELIQARAEYKHLLVRAYWSKIATAMNIAQGAWEERREDWKNILKKMQGLCLDIDINQYGFSCKYKIAYHLFSKFPVFYIKAVSRLLK